MCGRKQGFVAVWVTAGVLAMASVASAGLYDFNGTDVLVDYWADDGSASPTNEVIIVIDWNAANGPYATEAHAWGYRWSGSGKVKDALEAIDAAGALDLTYASGGGFLNSADYVDLGIDADVHTTTGNDWAWIGGSTDGGQTWVDNGVGVHQEPLVDGGFEAVNYNYMDWTDTNLTIPVPEPMTAMLLAAGGFGMLRRHQKSGQAPA